MAARYLTLLFIASESLVACTAKSSPPTGAPLDLNTLAITLSSPSTLRSPVRTQQPFGDSVPSATVPPTPSAAPFPPLVQPTRFATLESYGHPSCGAVSRDAKYLALQHWGGQTLEDPAQLVLWDTASWSEVWRVEAQEFCTSLEFSPGTTILASGMTDPQSGAHRSVTLYDVQHGTPQRGIVDVDGAHDLSFSQSGESLSVANGLAFVYIIERLPKIASSGLLEPGLMDPAYALLPIDQSGYFFAAQFSPVGDGLALATTEGHILYWTLGDRRPDILIPIPGPCPETWKGEARALAFSHNGALLATQFCGHNLATYEWPLPTPIAVNPMPRPPLTLVFSRDNSTIAVGAEGAVFLWSVTLNSALCTLDTLGHSARALGFSPDGERLFAATGQGAVAQWDIDICSPN